MNATANTTARTPAVTTMASADDNSLVVRFADGTGLNLVIAELSPEIRARAMLHGLNAKLVDAAAIARSTETGRSATLEEKKAAVKAVFDRLVAGDWNKRAESGTASGSTLLVAALMRLKGKDQTEVSAYVDGLSKEQQAALKLNPKVSVVIAAIQAERAAAKGIDSDDLLEGL